MRSWGGGKKQKKREIKKTMDKTEKIKELTVIKPT